MNVIYEDEYIAVCEKPPFVSSEKSPGGGDMVTALENRYGREVYPVHRLDVLTGGLIVYALTKEAAAFLSEEIREGRFEKEYCAVVHGRPEADSGKMEDLLFFDRSKNKSFPVKKERCGVKKASLSYRVIDSCEKNGAVYSLVSVFLHTGRTHQIRVQFASRRMPVRGDGKYGSPDNTEAIALKSVRLAFRHPASGKRTEFKTNFIDLP